MKIEKMTDIQASKVSIYREKWLSNGRKTSRIDKEKAIKAISDIYEITGKKAPKHFFFFPSPIQCQLAVNVLKSSDFKNLKLDLGTNLEDNLRANLGDNLWTNLWANLGTNLGANLRDNLWTNLWANLGANLGDNLRANLGDNLRANLWDNLWANLWANLGANLGDNLRDNLWTNLRVNLGTNLVANLGANLRANPNLKYEFMFYGNIDVYWEGMYDFILNELFEKEISNYKKFITYCEALRNIHIFIPYEDIVFISDYPSEINLNQKGQLSDSSKSALMYEDGYSLFYINGVKVPKKLVETLPEKLDPKEWLNEKNAEVRSQALRKIGLGKVFKDLNVKIHDKFEDYELVEFPNIYNKPYAPFLKMINPSTGEVHVEGVHHNCKTVIEALAWRESKLTYLNPLFRT